VHRHASSGCVNGHRVPGQLPAAYTIAAAAEAISQTGKVIVDDAESRRDDDGVEAGCRLVTYGTLAPGRPNYHQLDGLDGRWLQGQVKGTLVHAGWGASLGYPALVLDPDGPAIDVEVFESVDLPSHWARLDDFEGPGYQRVLTTVHTTLGDVDASIYVLVPEQG
jgi:gamma-glutamylcyclotransferase (GGCT)/AIG2-like uncharacterized protein YtfP